MSGRRVCAADPHRARRAWEPARDIAGRVRRVQPLASVVAGSRAQVFREGAEAGENVSLTEVEAAAAQAPGVLEVAVVAQRYPVGGVGPVVPDGSGGRSGAAYVSDEPARSTSPVGWAALHVDGGVVLA